MKKRIIIPIVGLILPLLLIHFSLSAPVPFRVLFAGQKFTNAISLTNKAGHQIPDNDTSDGTASIAVKHWTVLDPNGNTAVNGITSRIEGPLGIGNQTFLYISFQVPRLGGGVIPGTNYTISASIVEIPFLYNGTDWNQHNPIIIDNKIFVFQIQNSPQALLEKEPTLASIMTSLKSFLCSNYGLYC